MLPSNSLFWKRPNLRIEINLTIASVSCLYLVATKTNFSPFSDPVPDPVVGSVDADDLLGAEATSHGCQSLKWHKDVLDNRPCHRNLISLIASSCHCLGRSACLGSSLPALHKFQASNTFMKEHSFGQWSKILHLKLKGSSNEPDDGKDLSLKCHQTFNTLPLGSEYNQKQKKPSLVKS